MRLLPGLSQNLVTRGRMVLAPCTVEVCMHGKHKHACYPAISWPISMKLGQLTALLQVHLWRQNFWWGCVIFNCQLLQFSCLWTKSADFFRILQVWVKSQFGTKTLFTFLVSWCNRNQLPSADTILNEVKHFLVLNWFFTQTWRILKKSADLVHKQLN